MKRTLLLLIALTPFAALTSAQTGAQTAGGVLFPCSFVSGVKGQTAVQHLEMLAIEINPAIDDTVFRPANSGPGH
jgi:hypothetical protein